MILEEPNLFKFAQDKELSKKHIISVTAPLTDSIGDMIEFYIKPSQHKDADYVITDDNYSLDSPVLYANKEILTGIIEDWNSKIKVNQYDEIYEYATKQNLNDRLIDFLQTLIFAQGVDWVLCHLSGKAGNHYLSPVVVARKLDGIKHAVEKKHLKNLPGLIDSVKKGLSI